jgi:hypothetical protein
MVEVAQVAAYSQMNTKHIKCGKNVQLLNVKLVAASRNQQDLKG